MSTRTTAATAPSAGTPSMTRLVLRSRAKTRRLRRESQYSLRKKRHQTRINRTHPMCQPPRRNGGCPMPDRSRYRTAGAVPGSGFFSGSSGRAFSSASRSSYGRIPSVKGRSADSLHGWRPRPPLKLHRSARGRCVGALARALLGTPTADAGHLSWSSLHVVATRAPHEVLLTGTVFAA